MTPVDALALAAGVDLVATDLDGTLLQPDGTVSAYAVEVLGAARDAGLPVALVTGRPPRWIRPIADAIGHVGTCIGANGAVVLDLATDRVLRTHPLDPEALDAVVGSLRAQVPGLGFAVEWVDEQAPYADTFGYERGYPIRYVTDLPPQDRDVREIARGRQVVKLLARVAGETDHDADSLLALAVEHVEHLVTVTHSNSDDVLLEMSARGVTKGSTLAEVAAGLGVPPPRCAAAGDMPNDVPMLVWAGAGLGVPGAHPAVLAVADAVLPADDGVARFVAAVLAHRP